MSLLAGTLPIEGFVNSMANQLTRDVIDWGEHEARTQAGESQ